MIYLITHAEAYCADNKIYKMATADELLCYLSTITETSIDTETTGFDPHQHRLITMQIGNNTDQYIIDCQTVDISFLKSSLETITLIGQNLKFDLKFLYKQHIYPRKLWDTMVVERILHCGLPEVKVGLSAITERYLGIKLDKSIRENIHKTGLNTQLIQYGANDIKYLPLIKEMQLSDLLRKGLKGVANLENRFTPCLAYIEYCGFKLDKDKWLVKMNKNEQKLQKAEANLNNWIINKGMTKFFRQQISLFDAPSCKINWSSSKQVMILFEELGIDCSIIEKGTSKKSIEAGNLEKHKDQFGIIPLYLEYKKAEKTVSTYGRNFLRQINESTNRIHSNFTQIMDTGRLSSGRKDKISGEEYINFQNIPKDPETRSCFIAEPGNTLIIADYSGQEQVVLANLSMDNTLLKFYDNGFADMHAFVASKMYRHLEAVPLELIKTKFKEERQEAKIAGFAINYGGTGQTIADQLGKSKEDGDRIYNAYFEAFPGLRTHFSKVKKQGLKDGYILISKLTGRKSYLPFFSRFKELESKMTSVFWDQYKSAKEKNAPEFSHMKQLVSDYFLYKGEIERKTLNFPIQGSSAEITKISCVYIYDYIIDHKLFGIVKFVNTIHDENVLECPTSLSSTISEMVQKAMFKAGRLYCTRVPLTATPEISTYWKK